MVGRGVLRFKKGVCSKRVSGSAVLEAFSSRARFICTTVVQIGVAQLSQPRHVCAFPGQIINYRPYLLLRTYDENNAFIN